MLRASYLQSSVCLSLPSISAAGRRPVGPVAPPPVCASAPPPVTGPSGGAAVGAVSVPATSVTTVH